MSFSGRLAALPPGPFARLAALLGDTRPGKAPISLAVGDPSGTVPGFVKEALANSAAGFGNYPAIIGTQDWRQAAAAWLNRRFALNGAMDTEKNLLPLSGTREGLFSVLFPVMPQTKAGGRPIVAMPNPFYQCYAAAALGSGAEPLYVPARKENGFLPDFAGLPPATLERLAAVYICSPSNPEGAVADAAYWTTLLRLAERHDFIVLADECYADIWFDQEPVCALPSWLAQSGSFGRLLSFHSLSKRSGLPGLRSGLVAGDAGLIEKFRAFRNVAGPHRAHPPAGGLGGGLARRGACDCQSRRLSREDGRGNADPGCADGPAAGRLLPVAGCRQWRGFRPQGLARTGGAGAGRRLYGKGNFAGGNPVKPWLFLCPGGAC